MTQEGNSVTGAEHTESFNASQESESASVHQKRNKSTYPYENKSIYPYENIPW